MINWWFLDDLSSTLISLPSSLLYVASQDVSTELLIKSDRKDLSDSVNLALSLLRLFVCGVRGPLSWDVFSLLAVVGGSDSRGSRETAVEIGFTRDTRESSPDGC